MLILTIRTDKPEAEIGLYEHETTIEDYHWPAHRQLAETIHLKLQEMLAGHQRQLADINGIAFYQGPGSFTGLRIGASVANALAAGLNIHIVGGTGDDWRQTATGKLVQGKNEQIIVPEYGALPHITQPKH